MFRRFGSCVLTYQPFVSFAICHRKLARLQGINKFSCPFAKVSNVPKIASVLCNCNLANLIDTLLLLHIICAALSPTMFCLGGCRYIHFFLGQNPSPHLKFCCPKSHCITEGILTGTYGKMSTALTQFTSLKTW